MRPEALNEITKAIVESEVYETLWKQVMMLYVKDGLTPSDEEISELKTMLTYLVMLKETKIKEMMAKELWVTLRTKSGLPIEE